MRTLSLLLLAGVLGCTGDDDGVVDTGFRRDAQVGRPDSTVTLDAGETDAGAEDAGQDAGEMDAALPDAGDGGPEDGGPEDGGPDGGPDAGDPDTGAADTGAPDAGAGVQLSELVITEVVVIGAEWIEIYNSTGQAIDIAGGALATSAGSAPILHPDGVSPVLVPAGGYVVGYPSSTTGADFLYGVSFDDAGDIIRLTANGGLQDELDYSAVADFPLIADRSTQTNLLDAVAADDLTAWCAPVFRDPTPGAVNVGCQDLLVSEVVVDFASFAGNADLGNEWIELAGAAGADLVGLNVAVSGGPTIALTGRMPNDGLLLIGRDDGTGATNVPGADLIAVFDLPDGGGSISTGTDLFAWGTGTGEGTPVPALSTTNYSAAWARSNDQTDTQDNLADFRHDPSPTPGALNGVAAFAVTAIEPDDAVAGVDSAVQISGADFTDLMTVTVDGAPLTGCTPVALDSLDCPLPYPAGGSGLAERVDVQVAARPEQGDSVTLVDGFTWTTSNNETDLPTECDFCNLQFPASTTTPVGVASELIFGQIFEAGLTDVTSGPAPGILAELGYGPTGTDPAASNAWTFTPAAFNVEVGNNDEFLGTLTIDAAGSYAYTYRFSLDGGLTWSYGDTDGSGSNGGLAYSSALLGTITVN